MNRRQSVIPILVMAAIAVFNHFAVCSSTQARVQAEIDLNWSDEMRIRAVVRDLDIGETLSSSDVKGACSCLVSWLHFRAANGKGVLILYFDKSRFPSEGTPVMVRTSAGTVLIDVQGANVVPGLKVDGLRPAKQGDEIVAELVFPNVSDEWTAEVTDGRVIETQIGEIRTIVDERGLVRSLLRFRRLGNDLRPCLWFRVVFVDGVTSLWRIVRVYVE